jgi:hypothetical protein
MWFFNREVNHLHSGYRWDNYYEWCKCGVSAGNYIRPNGLRAIFFEEWPEHLRKAKGRV